MYNKPISQPGNGCLLKKQAMVNSSLIFSQEDQMAFLFKSSSSSCSFPLSWLFLCVCVLTGAYKNIPFLSDCWRLITMTTPPQLTVTTHRRWLLLVWVHVWIRKSFSMSIDLSFIPAYMLLNVSGAFLKQMVRSLICLSVFSLQNNSGPGLIVTESELFSFWCIFFFVLWTGGDFNVW